MYLAQRPCSPRATGISWTGGGSRRQKTWPGTPTRGRPTEKTVKLETCFEYLDTRDDYSVMMMMIFVIFRTVTLTDLLLRSPSFMSNARGPQESPHLSMKVLLTFIQNLLKKHLELRWPTRCTFSFVCDIYSDSIYCHFQPNADDYLHSAGE